MWDGDSFSCEDAAFATISGTAQAAQGGTGLNASPDDTALVGNGSTWQAKTLPQCMTGKLLYDTAVNAFSCGVDATGGAAGTYSGVGVCAAGTFASTLNDNAAPICTQPGFSSLSGVATVAQGGTGVTTAPDDGALVGNGTAYQARTLPSCSNAATSKLLYDSATNAFSCGADQVGSGGGSADPLTLIARATPAAPADGITLFSRNMSGRRVLAYVAQDGLEGVVQAGFSRNRISFAHANGNSTTVSQVGMALTAAGTATGANWASTNAHTSMRRIDYLVTTAATTAVAGVRGAAQQFWRGNAAGLGGFHFVARWAPATGQATVTSRAFMGLRASTAAPTDTEPSAGVSQVGMGWDANDANAQVMVNDASGVSAKVDLGASFAVSTVDRAKVYELSLYAAPNGSSIAYEVTDLATGAVSSGNLLTDLPANTTALNPYGYASVGGTSSVIGFSLFSLYIETNQ